MSFIRQLIEKKISSATGATVMFGDFKFSPMSGTIEIIDLKVAAERFVPPFLSIGRVEAKVAVARALRGEICVREMTIERPVLICNVHADGKTNLHIKSHAKDEAIVPKEGAAGGSWEFNAEKIALTHGRIEFRDATHNNYKLAVEGINATLVPDGPDLALTLVADSIGRRDATVELGTFKLLAKLIGGGFRDPLSSALSCRASIADTVVVQATSTMIKNRLFEIEVAGAMKLATLMGMLPMSPRQTWAVVGDGKVDLRGTMTLDLMKHIRVSNLEMKVGSVNIDRTFGHFAGDGSKATTPPPVPIPAT